MTEPRDAAIAVVVVTHESAATIDECLVRLRAAADVSAIRVVDNNSGDGTMDIIQRHAASDPRVRFIANPDNPGFAVACNQGAAEFAPGAQDARWLAFVNPDCLVESDTLARLRAHAEPLGDVILGADLVDEDGQRDAAARRHDPDFGGMLRRLLRAPSTATRLDIAPDDGQTLQRVEAVSGALLLLQRTLFDRIGGFDTDYRLHAEDLDLCRRAREAGATIAVANHVRVIHVRGVSSRARPLFVEWHKHRGLWRYFSKFEAPRRGPLLCGIVFVAIWLKFPIAAVRAWSRSLS
jgi:N-acetylglucosaminyl-diphospho-decaprenol L-rhamnosyltransferase